MKKTYADICLERAEKAMHGPWKMELCSTGVGCWCRWISSPPDKEDSYVVGDGSCSAKNAEFIANARTDVPELARRLKLACEQLRRFSCKRRDDEFINELEAPMGDE